MAEISGGEANPVKLLIEVIGILVLLAIAWFATGGPERFAANGGPFIKPLAPVDSGQIYGNLSNPTADRQSSTGGVSGGTAGYVSGSSNNTGASPWSGKIKIDKGSASSAIQPPDEYIILRNVGSDSVNITGWVLKNGGTVQGGSGILRGSQRSVVIPAGVNLYVPNQANTLGPVILQKGERAVITTGGIAASSPYSINSSFRTNICTGYFDKLPNYVFKPSLPLSCPDNTKEPGIGAVDDACYKFIRSMGRCHTPEFKVDTVHGGESIDGKVGFTPACENFLKLHYNYFGCLSFHGNDENFFGKEWRVFLNTLPLWSKDRETIFLYDSSGRLVTSVSY